MARKTTKQALWAAKSRKAAVPRGPRKRAAADAKAAKGALPQWSTADIEEAFRRFAAANPVPRGELRHVDPFTLIVAVVLSAQATDAGVNRSEEHTSELQSQSNLVCRLLLEKKKSQTFT